ncbi:VOC family protein [Nitrosomonas sp. HPC101]|uniref:VOC family protein n=1 Tax=Nitrosomonas sp. HPC101 TaxID=1658667 RepID=UPI00136BD05D|nr:VOC family protein [Nitrosomonas sp. HPC101]MXS86046.1 VOC family protein [Nitrosomonas sp. HPC101]
MKRNQSNPVVWFEIYVQDMERAKAFYEAVLAVTLEKMPAPTTECEDMEMWGFPSDKDTAQTTYGACGMLVKMTGVPSGCGGTLIYFGCEDCAVQAARAAENGGSIFKEKFSIGKHGFIALVNDTEGNMIGFHSM